MGYVLRVRLASFFTGAATASFAGLYILHRDYKLAHQSLTQQGMSQLKEIVYVVYLGLETPPISILV
ncbi:hypothetical protein TSUD_319980 [Trifolium subterraneum]|uniref:Uncharacterized protein n=1 Tax=Trifolium subterraneum TaxID=3900 RepID=A0A2Z6MS36_TRISU|nr:hypothetical protein TSUD_319980 [Trifolium subterraneum]